MINARNFVIEVGLYEIAIITPCMPPGTDNLGLFHVTRKK